MPRGSSVRKRACPRSRAKNSIVKPGGSRIVERSADGAGWGRIPTQPARPSTAPHTRRGRRNRHRDRSDGGVQGAELGHVLLSGDPIRTRDATATLRGLPRPPPLLQCRPMATATPDPIALVVEDRARARAAGDPLADLCVLATGGGAEEDGSAGVRPIVLRDVGPQGIGLLISRTSPKWEPLSAGRYEVLLLWLTIRRQYRVRGGWPPCRTPSSRPTGIRKFTRRAFSISTTRPTARSRPLCRRASGSSRESTRCASGILPGGGAPSGAARGVYLGPERSRRGAGPRTGSTIAGVCPRGRRMARGDTRPMACGV